MQSLILTTTTRLLAALLLMFSVYALLRGHNLPGGGFIGGLIAASALAIYGIACGVGPVRRALPFHPMTISAAGLFAAVCAGIFSLFASTGFMTGLWVFPKVFGTELALSTPLIFDIGVYLVVVGGISSIALALEERESD